MSELTCSRSDLFPVGTVVKAYPMAGRVTGAKPSGASEGEGTVDATGKLAIALEGRYVLAAEVASVWRQLVVSSFEFLDPGNLQERIAARRARNGVVY